MNFVQIVGTINKMPERLETSTADKYSVIYIGVVANFREPDGTFRIDTFKVRLWRGMSDIVVDRCVPGVMLAVKGRMESDGENYIIVAENVEFLHPKVALKEIAIEKIRVEE